MDAQMTTLETFFDKIFVLNLNRRPDRWLECIEELKAHGIAPGWVERVQAYDNPDNGHAGCTRSHRALLRRVAASDWERVLVLEDDFAVITLDRIKAGGWTPDGDVWKTHMSIPCGANLNERFAYLSKHLPGHWDVVYLGASYGEPPIERYNKHVIRCGFMQTTGSYGITRDFAKVWTRKVDASMPSDDLSHHPGPIDNVFGSMSHDHRYYVFQPRLMYQRESKSDLDGQTNSRLGQMTDTAHEILV